MVVERVNPIGRRGSESQRKQSKATPQAKAQNAPASSNRKTQSKKKSSSTEGAGWPAPDWLMARGGSALGVPYRAEPSRLSSPVSYFVYFILLFVFSCNFAKGSKLVLCMIYSKKIGGLGLR
ncbi:hypothetical protein ASPBRDRAFT_220392 [Aspergillus brasiliensis CBS 101740]|uniref:Uncharacterized protein n=1 Tax=Aspergillus brasiliensis (strain CBS 101740 / IMI 381727 / IBT 21946) TaxID=767769 RepID=A0A1L9UZ49_ASPBC|nr:hypothetical protein ASPBRDRAFT_220392 [Aspergillus brasiliensis CBS 101740]